MPLQNERKLEVAQWCCLCRTGINMELYSDNDWVEEEPKYGTYSFLQHPHCAGYHQINSLLKDNNLLITVLGRGFQKICIIRSDGA